MYPFPRSSTPTLPTVPITTDAPDNPAASGMRELFASRSTNNVTPATLDGDLLSLPSDAPLSTPLSYPAPNTGAGTLLFGPHS